MANYHEYSTRECTKQSEVGLGYGSTPDGEPRVCVALGGDRINPEMEDGWGSSGWISMTDDVAAHLHELLSQHVGSRVKVTEIGEGPRKYRLVHRDGSVTIVRAHLMDVSQSSLLIFVRLEKTKEPTTGSCRCKLPPLTVTTRRLVYAVPLTDCKEVRELYETQESSSGGA